MSQKTNRFQNFGTAQKNRFFEAMDGDYVKIDEKGFEDHLMFASRLSKYLNFYDEDDKVNGDWSHFFSDESVVLASISDTDPSKNEKRFKSYVNKIALFKRAEKKDKYILRCFKEVFTIASYFNGWYIQLRKIESFANIDLQVRSEIESAITTKLASLLVEFQDYYKKRFKDQIVLPADALSFEDFDKIWFYKDPSDTELEETKKKNKEEDIFTDLQRIFQGFYETLLYLKTKTPYYMEQSMKSDTHYPEVALYLAFLKLYTYTQENINNITSKHVSYYYKEILKQSARPYEIDYAYIQFKLDNGARTTKVPKGITCIGVDPVSNKDVRYEIQDELLVNQGQIRKAYSVYVDSTMLRGGDRPFRKIDDIYFAELAKSYFDSSISENSNEATKLVALFGEDQDNKGHLEKNMTNAEVGFAFSSPNLYLKGGFRDVEIKIQLDDYAYEVLIKQLKGLSEAVKDDFEEFFIKAFTESFIISLSTSNGWMNLNKYVVKRDDASKTLSFSFEIKNTDPAIVGFDKGLHEGTFNTKLPVVRFLLNSEAFIYPYTLLAKLEIEQVWFDVKVRKLKSLQLYNNIGQLSPDAPFLPFGPTPKVGAYFVVGSNEAFNKTLDDVRVNIDWFDLPLVKEGFGEHYKAYDKEIDNGSFEAKLSILDSGYWKPESKEDQQTVKLFRTEQSGLESDPTVKDRLLESAVISKIDMTKLNQAADYKNIDQQTAFSTTSNRGFIKLELSGPLHGFGHDVYPAILSESIMHNAKTGLFKGKDVAKKKETPLQPYTPQIKSISIDYESSAAISLMQRGQKQNDSSGEVFHIHPFGLQRVFPGESDRNTVLLPHYDFEGAAYLGFEGINPPESITLLFEMIDEYTESSDEGTPQILWDYLVKDEWKPLAQSRILKDETNNFLKTGIIQIALPRDIVRNNTILDSDLYWLRISVQKNIDTVSSLKSIATNVTVAKLTNAEDLPDTYLKEPLPGGSVKRLLNHIPGIKELKQSLVSFGGVGAEDTDQFHTRIGERLRHKGRAVTAWDYERIILDKFPEISHVTCLANMTNNSSDASGNVLLVVIPHKDYSANENEPMASSELLINIKAYMQHYSSPFVKNTVRNPSYERIKIICNVRFSDSANYGYNIQKLNEQINEYLRGSLLSQTKKIALGGSINCSDVVSYIRTLPYVELVERFSMVQVSRDLNGDYQLVDTAREEDQDTASLQATKPWSILVPAPEHQISELEGESGLRPRHAGIDSLELGHDFVIED